MRNNMKKKDALIGYTGFVGGTLLNQMSFEEVYRKNNIIDIQNKSFNRVICAGAPAQKWIANKEPVDDLHDLILDLEKK